MNKALNKEAIKFIREYADARYDQGWDVVVECYDSVDIQETLDQHNGDIDATIAYLAKYVELHEERRVEVESTIF